jgi:hypothetical protein
MVWGSALAIATFSSLWEKLIMLTPAFSASTRSIMAWAGSRPVRRATSARVFPASSSLEQVATITSSQPLAPEPVRQRSPSTRQSAMARARDAGSASRSRSLAVPPSCIQAGRRLSILVLPAG